MTEGDDLTAMGVAGALAAQYAADQRDFMVSLASLLEAVMPAETRVERRGGLFGPKEVHGLSVQLDDYVYAIQAPPRGTVSATRTKVVRGIKLKTEPMPPDEWVAALSGHLADLAARNQRASDALRQIMGG